MFTTYICVFDIRMPNKILRMKGAYIIWIYLYKGLNKVNLEQQKADQQLTRLTRLTGKKHKEMCWGDENMLYLDCNSGYTNGNICQNSSNCTFKRCI